MACGQGQSWDPLAGIIQDPTCHMLETLLRDPASSRGRVRHCRGKTLCGHTTPRGVCKPAKPLTSRAAVNELLPGKSTCACLFHEFMLVIGHSTSSWAMTLRTLPSAAALRSAKHWAPRRHGKPLVLGNEVGRWHEWRTGCSLEYSAWVRGRSLHEGGVHATARSYRKLLP